MANDQTSPWHPQDEPGPGSPPPEAIERGHERSTVGIRTVVIVAAGFIGFLIFAHLLMINSIRFLHRIHGNPETFVPPPNVTHLPPAPPLLPDQPASYAEMQRVEKRVLHSYGWVDRNAGTVRVPIQRAFDLLLQKHSQTAAAQDGKSDSPGGEQP